MEKYDLKRFSQSGRAGGMAYFLKTLSCINRNLGHHYFKCCSSYFLVLIWGTQQLLIIYIFIFIFYVDLRLQTGKLRYKFIFACTIWTLKEKWISFCNVLFMWENHSLCIKYSSENYALKSAPLPHANTQSNVINRYGSDLNVSMKQYHQFIHDIH